MQSIQVDQNEDETRDMDQNAQEKSSDEKRREEKKRKEGHHDSIDRFDRPIDRQTDRRDKQDDDEDFDEDEVTNEILFGFILPHHCCNASSLRVEARCP